MKHHYIKLAVHFGSKSLVVGFSIIMFGLIRVFVIAVSVVVICAQEQQQAGSAANKLSKDCEKSYSATCFKLDVVSFVDRLAEKRSLQLAPGVSLERENETARASTSDMVVELAREFPNDAEARLDAFLMKKITGYLNSHSIRFKLFDNTQVVSARKKDKGGFGAILAAILMMKGTLGALGFGALAALAGKALMTGLMALMLSAIVGIKSLAHGGHKQTTYEIVSKPIYSHAHTHSSSHEEVGHHGHYGGGYGRNLDLPIPLSIQNSAWFKNYLLRRQPNNIYL